MLFSFRLSHPSWLVLSSNPDEPVYLANRQHLALAMHNLSQEEFVSKVSTTDSIFASHSVVL